MPSGADGHGLGPSGGCHTHVRTPAKQQQQPTLMLARTHTNIHRITNCNHMLNDLYCEAELRKKKTLSHVTSVRATDTEPRRRREASNLLPLSPPLTAYATGQHMAVCQ
jgi:hypothetical protein